LNHLHCTNIGCSNLWILDLHITCSSNRGRTMQHMGCWLSFLVGLAHALLRQNFTFPCYLMLLCVSRDRPFQPQPRLLRQRPSYCAGRQWRRMRRLLLV
jgi:hypothetical protein